MPEPVPSLWSCFSHRDGSDLDSRYRDVLGVRYAYDSTVPNHKALKKGDAIVVRDDSLVLGHGLIQEVLSQPSHKSMMLCRSCRRSGPDARRTKQPTYRCPNCKDEFDRPLLEDRRVTRYEAWYEGAWAPLPAALPRTVLDGLYDGADQQNAIRRLKHDPAIALLRDHTGLDGLADLQALDPARRASGPPVGGHVPSTGRRRLGQNEFKDILLARFGPVCAVSGPQPLAVLDAAHLYRFADTPHHHLDGGLLLRTDLHRLFDRILLTVDTATWTVQLHPDLQRYPGLAPFQGVDLRVCERDRPRKALLDDHHREAQRRWAL